MAGKLIYLFGIDGCGKTTLLRNLQHGLTGNTLCLQTFSKPFFTNELEFAAGQLESSKRAVFSQQFRSSVWMLDLVKIANEIIKPKMQSGYDVVVDRYALCCKVYLEVLNNEEINYMGQVLDCLPQPDIGFYLNITANEAVERIQKRNENIAPYEQVSFLNKLKTRYEQYIVQQKYPIYTIDASGSEKEIYSSIIRHIS